MMTAVPCVVAAFGCLWISLTVGAILGLVCVGVMAVVQFIIGEESRPYEESA